jgi:DNA-binding HxlR family transcriptional regulator
VLGDRWTLLIIREMLFGVQRFNELERFLPGISRSVLAQRLRHLQRVGLVERHADADGQRSLYLLTQAGRDLPPVVRAIGNWGAKWAFGDPDPAELDPDLVVQWISRHLAWEELPPRRVVVQFAVTGPPVRRYWLVIQPEDVSVCMHDPGFGVDAVFRSDARTLYQVYTGELALPDAQRSGRLELDYFRRKFDADVLSIFGESWARLEHDGMLTLRPGEVNLTRSGMLQVDRLLPNFFEPEHRGTRYT